MTVLAFDFGGTKILAALVTGGQIIDRIEVPTDRHSGPDRWLEQMRMLAAPWAGRANRAGITVTGLVQHGLWSALNPDTLAIPDNYPLQAHAEHMLGLPVTLGNDAQAAAWGEYRHGAGAGRDMVFLTISTGIGGGVVTGGKLLTGRSGMAGSFGQLRPMPDGHPLFEACASGRWIAATLGQDAKDAFQSTDPQAQRTIATSATRVARLCQNLQLIFDHEIIVIGGGIGLAPGYLTRITTTLAALPDLYRPTLTAAALGADAGAIGIAALALQRTLTTHKTDPTAEDPS